MIKRKRNFKTKPDRDYSRTLWKEDQNRTKERNEDVKRIKTTNKPLQLVLPSPGIPAGQTLRKSTKESEKETETNKNTPNQE
jgi:hypothetical protein